MTTCTHALECGCSRCTRVRRLAYRDGLRDAHAVFAGDRRSWTPRGFSPAVLRLVLPELERLEWSAGGTGLLGLKRCAACPVCGAVKDVDEHDFNCSLADALAQARVAAVQPELFGEGV